MNWKHPKVQRWLRSKWPILIGCVLAGYTLLGFFAVPAIIKSQMLKRLPAATKRTASVQQVKLNPYVLSLTVRGFGLKEPNGDTFASFDEVYVNLQLFSIFKRRFVFKEISVKKPFGSVIFQPDGKFNFSNLVPEPPSQPKPKEKLPRLDIERLIITDGAVAFADLKRKEPFRSRIGPINIQLGNFTTRLEGNSPYSIAAQSDSGGSFHWAGNASINPVASVGTFKLTGLQLKKYTPYIQDFVRVDVVDGTIALEADYRLDSSGDQLELDLSKAGVDFANLQVKALDTSEMVVAVPALSVKQAEASLRKQTVRIGSISSSDASILARLNKDGTINFLSLLNPPTEQPAKTSPDPADTTPWVMAIDEFKLVNYTVKAEDLTHTEPAHFTLDRIGLTLKGLSTETNNPISVALGLRFNEVGTIMVSGNVLPFKPFAELEVQVTDLDLRAFQPYVEDLARFAVTGGLFSTKGRVRYGATTTNASLAEFTGEFGIAKLATVETDSNADFVKWEMVAAKGIEVQYQPTKVAIEETLVAGLSGNVLVKTNKSLNVASTIKNPTRMRDLFTRLRLNTEFPLRLGRIALENGSLRFTDESIQPNVVSSIDGLSGDVQGLSSTEQEVAKVNFQGKMDSHSTFSISGQMNPLADDLLVDLLLVMRDIELTTASPYTAKYAGYALDKGKLSLELKYRVSKKSLEAENGIRVDQLMLGPRSDSPDATKLPVKLALALLQDSQGVIQLNLPIRGNLDDPEFKLGKVIVQVLLNIITQAATAPFALLGSMFGGGEELSFVSFQPGRADFAEGEIKKLDTLATALLQRPALNLEITGSFDPVKEREALAKIRLEEDLKARLITELTAKGKGPTHISEIRLEPPDYERLLRLAYSEAMLRGKVGAAVRAEDGASSSARKPQAVDYARSKKPSSEITRARDRGVAGAKTEPETRAPSPSTSTAQSVAEMEAELARAVELTDDDFQKLMQERALKVQGYLAQTGKVPDSRLFVVTPKPGGNRANLSLR